MLIDVALDRRPYAQEAAALIEALEQGRAEGFIAWHTVANFHYLVAPKHERASAKAFLVELTRFIQVAPTRTESVRYAANLPMPNFEDALQVAAAVACGAAAIATRNVRDFARSPIRAAVPRALLDELGRLTSLRDRIARDWQQRHRHAVPVALRAARSPSTNHHTTSTP